MKTKISKEQLFTRLANTEDARACKGIDDAACKVVSGNYVTLLLSQVLSQFADALLNPKVTLPWLLHALNVPSAFIAWLVPIRESGSLLPQLAIADYVRSLPIRKWVWVFGAMVQALSIFAMVIVGLTLDSNLAGFAIIALLVIFSLARGFNSVAAKDVLGKTIPKKQRGGVSGYAASAAGFATITFGLGLWYFQRHGDKASVLIALGAGALMWVLAALVYAKIDEYPGATEGGKNGLLHALGKLRLLIDDKPFAHFVLTRALLLCSALSAPFYIVLASEQGFNFSLLAVFLALSGFASLISGPFWGHLSDRSSKQVLVFASILVSVNGLLVYLVATNLPSLLTSTFFLPGMYLILTIAHQGVRLGRKTYLVDMADGNKRTDYVAVSNTVIGVCLLALGSLGFLGNWLNNAELILIYSLMGIAGALSAILLPRQ
ncbi:MFS transporter [Pseudoalteromonas sp. T1lg75]|uniref:MFS transporter n=1 Tax=Pseudoalteromonas sp. T1lg75 TaxID=2077102 RepID=UPI000CF6101F|nr:MFS transporter [Pseudoalteromonas sp. T1lg75]